MDKKTITVVGIGGVAIAAALLFLMNRRDNGNGSILVSSPDNAFTNPYITDGKMPGTGFNSTVNLKIDVDPYAGLSNKYMPVFGFVGVGVTGTLPTSINNVIVNQTPPAKVVAAAAPAPAPSAGAPTWGSGNYRTPLNGYYDLTGAAPRGLTSNLQRAGGGFGGF